MVAFLSTKMDRRFVCPGVVLSGTRAFQMWYEKERAKQHRHNATLNNKQNEHTAIWFSKCFDNSYGICVRRCFITQHYNAFARYIPADTKRPCVHISEKEFTLAPRCGLQIHNKQTHMMQLHKTNCSAMLMRTPKKPCEVHTKRSGD